MPIDLEFHNDEIVVLRAMGIVTYEEVVDSLRAIHRDVRFDIGAGKLVDLRKLKSAELGMADMPRILAEGLPLKQMAKGGRIAVIPPVDLSTALLRMYEQLAGRLPVRIEICRHLQHAHDWLGNGSDD